MKNRAQPRQSKHKVNLGKKKRKDNAVAKERNTAILPDMTWVAERTGRWEIYTNVEPREYNPVFVAAAAAASASISQHYKGVTKADRARARVAQCFFSRALGRALWCCRAAPIRVPLISACALGGGDVFMTARGLYRVVSRSCLRCCWTRFVIYLFLLLWEKWWRFIFFFWSWWRLRLFDIDWEILTRGWDGNGFSCALHYFQ